MLFQTIYWNQSVPSFSFASKEPGWQTPRLLHWCLTVSPSFLPFLYAKNNFKLLGVAPKRIAPKSSINFSRPFFPIFLDSFSTYPRVKTCVFFLGGKGMGWPSHFDISKGNLASRVKATLLFWKHGKWSRKKKTSDSSYWKFFHKIYIYIPSTQMTRVLIEKGLVWRVDLQK